MPELLSVRDAFGSFGAVPANDRWAWSARSPNGDVVVVTWWRDEIGRRPDGKLVYDCRNRPNLHLWQNRVGNRDRIRNLIHARDHCDGHFRIVWCKARDPREPTRVAVERYPDRTLWMKLIELNERTGEFLAEEV
jgi:hypothetical protein